MASPITELTGPVKALFTDLDGTLTTSRRVELDTFVALGKLAKAGVPVIIVTGRPAGWAHVIMSLTAAEAAIAENGGVIFTRERGCVRRSYAVPEERLKGLRRQMEAAVRQIMADIPSARMSVDSAYREVDLAIDWNEDNTLTMNQAQEIVDRLQGMGFAVSRSSVHINFGPTGFDKLSGCKTLVKELYGDDSLDDYVYVGDSLNDAEAFAGFKKSVGVANTEDVWDDLPEKPKFVTEGEEGEGLRQVIEHLLSLAK